MPLRHGAVGMSSMNNIRTASTSVRWPRRRLAVTASIAQAPLGKSDLHVSRFSLGTMTFGA